MSNWNILRQDFLSKQPACSEIPIECYDAIKDYINNTPSYATFFFITNIIICLLFAFIYYNLRFNDNFHGLDCNSSIIDAFYFSLTTHSTIGYGDIYPKTSPARLFVMIHHIIVLANLGNFLKNLFKKN